MAVRPLTPKAHTRISRLTLVNQEVTHRYPAVGPGRRWPLPSDAVEIVHGTFGNGLHDLIEHLTHTSILPALHGHQNLTDELRAGGMVIFVGYMNGKHRKGLPGDLLPIVNKKASHRSKSVVIIDKSHDDSVASYFQKKSVYDTHGYYDWGLSYTPPDDELSMITLASDVAGFWSSDHRVATVLIPGTTTLGGMLRGRTVMRKSDIMVSTNPPYEYLSEAGGDYPDELVQESLLVSEARKIWRPDTHYFAGSVEAQGKLLSHGIERMMTVGGRKGFPVVRWTSGDLEKGPIETPSGYPINKIYYNSKQGA